MISNIGKSTFHVSCIYSEVKAIKPTISNLSQNTHLRRLPANLNFGWQAQEGILEPGCIVCSVFVCFKYVLYISTIWCIFGEMHLWRCRDRREVRPTSSFLAPPFLLLNQPSKPELYISLVAYIPSFKSSFKT